MARRQAWDRGDRFLRVEGIDGLLKTATSGQIRVPDQILNKPEFKLADPGCRVHTGGRLIVDISIK